MRRGDGGHGAASPGGVYFMLCVVVAFGALMRLVAAQQTRAGPDSGGLAKVGPVLIDIFLVEKHPFFLLRLGRHVVGEYIAGRREGWWHRGLLCSGLNGHRRRRRMQRVMGRMTRIGRRAVVAMVVRVDAN